MPIPVKDDFAAKRAQLLAQLSGDPNSLAGFDDTYLQDTNNAYQQLAGALGGLDTAETDINTDYEKSYNQTLAQQLREREALQNKLAFRGIQSGSAAIDAESKFNQDYQNIFDQMATAKTRGLGDILSQRNAAQGAYTTDIGNAELGLTGGAKKYLADLAERQAAQRVASQDTTNQGAVGQTGVDINKTIADTIAAYNAKPIDMSQYANLFVQNQPVAPVKPVAAPAYKPPSISDPGRVAMTSSVNTGQLGKLTKPKNPWFGASKRS